MKILVQQQDMSLGGIEKSLSNFLNVMSKDNEIDLFLFKKTGPLVQSIPENVNVLEGNKLLQKRMPTAGGTAAASTKISFKYKLKKFLNKIGVVAMIDWFILKTQKKLTKDYDAAICFHGIARNCDFILKKVKAKTKLAMIHFDVAMADISKKELKRLAKMDKVICVSESCAKSFVKKYPAFDGKVTWMYNMQNLDDIVEKSKQKTYNFEKDKLNIITVSRITKEKAHIRTLEILKELKDEGYKFVWHVVGSGDRYDEVKQEAVNLGLEKEVVFYGNQVNPYGYVKCADVFLLCSYFEAAPMVYAEAMTLGVPVISTKTCSAEELVGEFGYVCENTKEALYETIKHVLENKKELSKKKELVKKYKFDNNDIKQRFYEICK